MPARVTTTSADSNDPGELTQQPLDDTRTGQTEHADRRKALDRSGTVGSVIVIQPVDHLNNRFSGWLSDNP
jgi:hypothetical protein